MKNHQFKIADRTKQEKLIALIAQAEIGNYRNDSFDLKQLYSEWILVFEGESREQPVYESNTYKRRKHNSGSSLSEDEAYNEMMDEFNISTSAPNLTFNSIERISSYHSSFYHSIVELHRQLDGYLPFKAESIFLEEISELDDIGIDYFAARIENEPNEKCKIGVGTRGVTIKQHDKKL